MRGCLLGCLMLGVALLSTGCSSILGQALRLMPDGHTLMPETRDVLQSSSKVHALPRELCKAPSPPYVVEAGDVLLIQPANLDSPIRLPGDQPVLSDGTVDLGIFGRLSVAGKTLDEIAAEVRVIIEKQVRDAGQFTVQPVTVKARCSMSWAK